MFCGHHMLYYHSKPQFCYQEQGSNLVDVASDNICDNVVLNAETPLCQLLMQIFFQRNMRQV